MAKDPKKEYHLYNSHSHSLETNKRRVMITLIYSNNKYKGICYCPRLFYFYSASLYPPHKTGKTPLAQNCN